ncbi:MULTISPECIES: hypothetical protein [Neisseria]|uniref:hypothetical protein n=1 Tax=Neisseria TaxID=482 RepID=UPI00189F25BD|nr:MULTISPECIES: hypothetical protein [Neisseria]
MANEDTQAARINKTLWFLFCMMNSLKIGLLINIHIFEHTLFCGASQILQKLRKVGNNIIKIVILNEYLAENQAFFFYHFEK